MINNTFTMHYSYMSESNGVRKRVAMASEINDWKTMPREARLDISKNGKEVSIHTDDLRGRLVVVHLAPYRESWVDFDNDFSGAVDFAQDVITRDWETAMATIGE